MLALAAIGGVPIGILYDRMKTAVIQLTRLEKELLAWHRDSDLSQRLATIPGVGIVSATALAASVSRPERFRNGRQFGALLGLARGYH